MTIAAVVLVFGVISQVADTAAISVVRCEGDAPGSGRPALRQAQDDSVLGAVIDALSSLAGTRDLSAFKPILDNALQYAGAVTLVRQWETDGSTFAEFDVEILKQRLREDMAMLALTRLPVRPKVLILVAEQPDVEASPTVEPDGETQRAIVEALGDRYFESVSPLWRLYTPEELIATVGGEPAALAQLAREHAADAAIVGQTTAAATPTAPQSNIFRCEVSLTLRVVRASDDALVDTIVADRSVNGPDTGDGVRLATGDAAVAAAGPVRTATAIAVTGLDRPEGVLISIEDLADPAHMTPIREFVASIWGVEKVEEMLARPGLGRLVAQYGGPMDLLVEPLASRAFDGFSLEVRQVVGRDVVLRAHAPGEAPDGGERIPEAQESAGGEVANHKPAADPKPHPEPAGAP